MAKGNQRARKRSQRENAKKRAKGTAKSNRRSSTSAPRRGPARPYQRSKPTRRLIGGLSLFAAVQLIILGVVGSFPAAVKATLGVAGVVIAVWAIQWFRQPKPSSGTKPSPSSSSH